MNLTKNLREWQKTALNKWVDNNYSGIVEVATAGGKTIFALECINNWLKIEPKSKVLVIVPTTALQDQWFLSLTEDFGIDKNNITVWPESKKIDNQFHLMVINTARKSSKKISSLNNKLMIIADECHRYASKENSEALKIPKDSSLGLTATAEREFDDGLNQILIPNLGKIIYKYSISDARSDKIVAEFEINNIKVPFSPSEIVEYKKISRRIAIAMSKNDLESVAKLSIKRAQVSRNAQSRIPVACKIVEENKLKRIIVFHEEIAKAELIYQTLKKRFNSVGIYHSKQEGDYRREILLQFRKGIISILVCCRALDEGVDIPESDVAIIAAATSSSRQRIQRIGRVIRLHKTKLKAKIYTLYITDQEEEKLKLEEEELSSISKIKWFKLGVS